MIITSASNDKLTNLGRCRLHFKLGEETFEYYFQIIKNLKWDLILGLNFQKTFKISQDTTDTEDLYLHIRNKIVTFSIQSTNRKNYICTQECVQIKPKDWKQFRVKAPKGLKTGEIYEVDFSANGFPRGVILLECTFIAGYDNRNLCKFVKTNRWRHLNTVKYVFKHPAQVSLKFPKLASNVKNLQTAASQASGK